MDGDGGGSSFFATIITLLIVLGTAGALIFLWMQFKDHKTDMEGDVKAAATKAEEANRQVASESTNRLGNIKYVVDQVNTVNEDIWNTYNTLASSNAASLTALSSTQESIMTGVDRFFKFSPDNATQRSLYQANALLSANDKPRLEMIQSTSFISGLTAKDLVGGTSNVARFCAPNGGPCIQFPDAQGDTFLKALVDGRNIVMDSPVKVNQPLGIGGPASTSDMLKIVSSRTDMNYMSAGNVRIDTAGNVALTDTTGTTKATLRIDDAGKLVIESNSGLTIMGNVDVMGTVSMNGAPIGSASPPTPPPTLEPFANYMRRKPVKA